MLARQLSLRFGVVSFSSCYQHPLMWSHYTVDGSGFVIGYEVEQLLNIAATSEYLRRVTYSSTPIYLFGFEPLAEPENNILIILSTKGSHWGIRGGMASDRETRPNSWKGYQRPARSAD